MTSVGPSVGELASEAAEAVRSLNHATFPGADGLVWPSDAYDVIASLGLLAARLPQLLAQLDSWLTRQVEQSRVVVDGGEYAGDPAAAAAVTSHWLEAATTAASQLHHALDRAQQATAFLAAAGDD